ncbi:MAG: GNAT family N-acetyltransferase [Verrucomicrobiota bacterium]
MINELILRSKVSWGYTSEELDLWKTDLEVTKADIDARHFFLGKITDRTILLYSLSEISLTSCELEDCWIDPEFKGRGFGRAIFDDIGIQMKRRGWQRMRIVSDPFAAGFYRAMGAAQVGESPSKPEGRLLPVFEWQLGSTKPNKAARKSIHRAPRVEI